MLTAMASSPSVQLTVLNSMAGSDVDAQLDQHVDWGLKLLDLKDRLFDKGITDLAETEAEQLAARLEPRGLRVHTFSTNLYNHPIEGGRDAFDADGAERLEHVLRLARILQPRWIRLIAARTRRRADLLDAAAYVDAAQPWLWDAYRRAIDRVAEAGFATLIENEVGGSLFSRPVEILAAFDAIDRPADAVRLTWDVQNLWQMGTWPSRAVYRTLRPLIGMVHLKGGQSERPGGPLRWAAYLDDAAWPIEPILREVIADGASPVLCINPSHGEKSDRYQWDYHREIEFLRSRFENIA
jgi:hypothetical protein